VAGQLAFEPRMLEVIGQPPNYAASLMPMDQWPGEPIMIPASPLALRGRATIVRSQGGTVARAGRNTYAPRSARLDLRPPRSCGLIQPHRTIYRADDANGEVARASGRRRFRALS
jgi:hypothetical protein